ncbi:MAG: hypothetical protein WA182_17780, partial [Candidatus Sulfotelmatobacter sp.]
ATRILVASGFLSRLDLKRIPASEGPRDVRRLHQKPGRQAQGPRVPGIVWAIADLHVGNQPRGSAKNWPLSLLPVLLDQLLS